VNYKHTGCCGVIAAYNEEKNLETVLAEVPMYLPQSIVVDDGSADRTAEVAKTYAHKGVITLRNEYNMGKALSLKKGIDFALGVGYNVIVAMDSDGQHLPIEIPLLLDKIYNEGFDLVIGARNFDEMPFANKYANILDSKIVSFITHSDVKDSQCGFRAMRSRIFTEGKLNLTWKRFTIEPQMTIEAILNGYKVGFADISTVYDSKRKSKIKVFQQGIDYGKMYFGYLFNRRREK
jgi:glycosyltransferase involved in cell wall biosynthesis